MRQLKLWPEEQLRSESRFWNRKHAARAMYVCTPATNERAICRLRITFSKSVVVELALRSRRTILHSLTRSGIARPTKKTKKKHRENEENGPYYENRWTQVFAQCHPLSIEFIIKRLRQNDVSEDGFQAFHDIPTSQQCPNSAFMGAVLVFRAGALWHGRLTKRWSHSVGS